jgi:hypothetical protein
MKGAGRSRASISRLPRGSSIFIREIRASLLAPLAII